MPTGYVNTALPENSLYTIVCCGPKFSLLCLYLLKWPLEWTKAADKLESIVTSNISLHPQYSSPLLIVADLAQTVVCAGALLARSSKVMNELMS